MTFEGSRRYVLEWLEKNDLENINLFFKDCNLKIENKGNIKPTSITDSREYEFVDYINNIRIPDEFPINDLKSLNKWWAPNGGTTPVWDLISICEINNKKGFLLIEGKAHIKELDCNGKKLKKNRSEDSKKNHDNIAMCIKTANDSLNKIIPGFKLSINTHYQLCNRIAWAWKISELKIPVVLVYLGFIGSNYFKDTFKTEDEWIIEIKRYMRKVVPDKFIGFDQPFSFRLKSIIL